MKKYVITGMIISLSLMTALTGCGKQAQAETNPTTAMETTVSETTTEAETTEVMTSSESGFNKEVYELLKLNWMNFLYTDENELRREAESMLQMEPGDENLEIIIQELLSLDRGQNTTQSESLTESKPVESTKAPAVESETKQAEPQQTTPAPQPQVNNNTDSVMSQEEFDAIIDQAAKDLGLGGDVDPSTQVTISDGISVDPEDNQGWNWH